ncbi:MAG: alpha/beta hydrolase [Devosia sp.]
MALSLLGIVNALSPKDAGSRRVARNVPYGRLPRQALDIYAPRQASGPLPVVFFVYGGSWMDGDRRHYEFAGRALAALGYVTVIADYRLVPAVEYPGFLDDCAEALSWVAARIGAHGGDGRRIALMGHSAGAYNAAMLALHPAYLAEAGLRDRVRCLVGLSGPYDFFPFDGPISLRTFGAVRDPATTQPVNHVSADAPPVLLGHGGKDRLVLPRNSSALAARLRAVGVTAEERHYPALGHPATLLALGRPARAIAPVLKDVAAFLDRHLAPAVPEARASAFPADAAPR